MVGSNNEEIKEMKDDTANIMDRLDQLERKLEATDQNMKACNIKIMNVEEDEREDEWSTTEIVVDLLNYHGQTHSWHHEHIARAFRIGKPRPHTSDPRPILVQFHRWTDKMAVLQDGDIRDSLRRNGIRVASDLTTRQRDMVEFHRGQGKIAYIRNGKLYVRDRYQDVPFRYKSDWYHSSEHNQHLEQMEDWPWLQTSQRDTSNKKNENLQYNRLSAGRNYRNKQRNQPSRHEPDHVFGDGMKQPEGRYYRKLDQSQYHNQWRSSDWHDRREYTEEYSSSRRLRDSWYNRPRDAELQESTRTSHIPVVPGSRSYSEVTKYHKPSRPSDTSELRRLVLLKDNENKPHSTQHPSPKSKQQKVSDADSQKSPARQTARSPVADDCHEDDILHRTEEEDRHSDTETEHSESSACQRWDNSLACQQVNDHGSNVSVADDSVTDTVLVDDTGRETETTKTQVEIVTKNDKQQMSDKNNDMQHSVDQTDTDTVWTRQTETDNTNKENVERLDTEGPDTTTNKRTDKQNNKSAPGMPDIAMTKDRQTRPSVRDLRPRRAASSTGQSRQTSVKTPTRSTSQSSIVDSFRKAPSSKQAKPKDRPAHTTSGTEKEPDGASSTNK